MRFVSCYYLINKGDCNKDNLYLTLKNMHDFNFFLKFIYDSDIARQYRKIDTLKTVSRISQVVKIQFLLPT